MQHGLTAADLAGTMHPYPTSAEVVRQAAQAFVRSQIFKAQNQEMLKTTSEECETVQTEVKGNFHIISLDRAESLNACNQVMAKCIAEAAERPARAVLLQSTQAGAEGKVAFCAGGDVKSVAQAVKEDPGSCFPRLQLAHEYLGVAALSKKREDGTPVICFMDGICMGFGLVCHRHHSRCWLCRHCCPHDTWCGEMYVLDWLAPHWSGGCSMWAGNPPHSV
eukprot:symbB.v1.2.009884.t1/scaffold639.1/size181572/5